MTFPAYAEDFHADPGRTYTRWAVYTALACTHPVPAHAPLPSLLRFGHAREIKIGVIAKRAGVSRRRTIDALDWLVANGYVQEFERGHNQMRRLALVYDRAELTLAA